MAAPTAWVEVGPEGRSFVRAIVSEASCPVLLLDGKPQHMSVRAAQNRDFPVTVCEVDIPADIRSMSIEGHALTLAKKNPERIVLFGDTGCTLSPFAMQKCLDQNDWPFEKLVAQAAALKPDLVIHLGDYLYREMPCLFEEGCKDSPYGNNWATWDADFFTPAQKLLQTTPWIFVRGNHENCYRGGFGWFRFFDPGAYITTCDAHAPLYSIPFENETFFVMDSSSAQDVLAPSASVSAFRQDFEAIQKSTAKHIWLLTHKPLLEIDEKRGTKTLKVASEGLLPPSLWIFSGHVHNFEVLRAGDALTQWIVGTGGGFLERPKIKKKAEHVIGIENKQFGFLLLVKKQGVWESEFHPLAPI